MDGVEGFESHDGVASDVTSGDENLEVLVVVGR